LGLIHPQTGRAMQWRADPPDDIVALCAALGFTRDDDAGEFDGEYDEYDDGDDAYDDEVAGAEGGDGEDWDEDAHEDNEGG
jgi:23S rRNA pseudouridine1911/1915/1917 synthase